MRKLFLSVSLVLFFVMVASAQNSSIKGSVQDTLEKKNLTDAVVSLLRSKDSVLVKYTRADVHGNFNISKLTPDSYVLLVTYPKFADYADIITLSAEQELDLGIIPLTLKSVLLSELIVKTNRAIRIKGDTTEFIADSFHVREGATVEDLLKQLPNMQVNSQGEITAQGKRVDKILVDGEEFFGTDPTIATQNIQARSVDKVQVYDTKTEQDQMKGIGASGEGNKTINIQLKENAKKGYFGNITGSTDFMDLMHAKVMYNKFKGKKKFSVYGTRSNISTGTLVYSDQAKLGFENDLEYDEIGGYYYSYGNDNADFSEYNLRGRPDAYTAGALYGNRWNEDRQNINLYYLYNRLGTVNRTTTISQTLLEDTTFYNNASSKSTGLAQRHVANAKYEWKVDSFATIKYTGVGTYLLKDSYTESYSEALNENEEFVNVNERTNELRSTKKQLDNALTYTQLFKKRDRRLITTLRLGIINDEQEGKLISMTDFYKNGIPDSTDPIDQMKINTGHSTSAGIRIVYNEPLTKGWNLVTEYSYNSNSSDSRRNSYNKDIDQKYSVLDTLFSNNFDLKAFSNSGTVTARYIGKKWRSAFGAGISAIQLNLDNLDLSSKSKYNFTGFTPQTQVSYMLKAQSSLSFSYRGSTVQPTLAQLQPLRNNNDPLSIYVGNPDLKVGFRHSLGMSYYNSKVLKGSYYYASFTMTFMPNAITNFSSTDQFGKTTYMPVNINGNNNWNIYAYWNSGQGDKKLIHSIQPRANGGRTLNFLNGKENINTYSSYYLGYMVRYNVTDKWSFNIGPHIEKNNSASSLRPTADNNYWSYGGEAYGYVKLPGDFDLSSNVNANLQQKTPAFSNPTRIIVWDADLKKKFFKNKSLELGIIAHDILNQNVGFNRTINSNFISEERFDRISRYIVLRAVWIFNKMADGK